MPADPTIGLRIARTWALSYGEAWVLSSDLMDPPHGILCNYKTWQSCKRALMRAGIELDEQEYDQKSRLYRLPPRIVQEIMGGS